MEYVPSAKKKKPREATFQGKTFSTFINYKKKKKLKETSNFGK